MAVAPTGLKWSADSMTIYSIGWTWPDAADDAAHKAKEKALKEAKSKAVVIVDRPQMVAVALDGCTGKSAMDS